MTTIATARPTIQRPEPEYLVDDAQLAAAAFLARYSGRTLDAYRHDLRGFFHWAADNAIPVLDATRPHIELYRAWMEQRGLAASTIDRRLSTVCGFYRFAHIDGRIGSNPAQYVRRPQVHPSDARGLDRSELGVFLFTAEQYDHDHAALAVLLGLNGLRVSEACATNVEDLGLERGHRTLRSSARATSPPPSRSFPAPHAPSTLPSANATRGRSCAAETGNASTAVPRIGGYEPLASGLAWRLSTRTCSGRRSSWRPSTPECPCATSRSPPATPTRAPPPSTTGDGRTSTATLRTSSSPSSPAADPGRATSSGTSGTSGVGSAQRLGTVPDRWLARSSSRR
jgi:hypothetical protein